jgi:hypothetical protein
MQELDLADRILFVADLDFEHVHEALELAVLRVNRLQDERRFARLFAFLNHALERVERRRVIGDDREDLAIAFDRPHRIAELVIPEIGNAIPVRNDFGRIAGEIRFALEDREKLLPVARRLVERIEAADRRQIIRLDLQDALVGVDRLGDVADLALVHRADFEVEALLLLGVEDDVGLALVDAQQLLPLLEPQIELDQLVERADLLRVDFEDLLVDLDRIERPLEELLVERRRAEEVLFLLVGNVEDLRLRQKNLGELFVALGELKQALERGGGLDL